MLPQTRLKSTLNTSPAHAAIVQFAKDWGDSFEIHFAKAIQLSQV